MEFASILFLLIIVVSVPFLREAFFPSPQFKMTGNEPTTSRSDFFDFIRGLAIVAVIVIHVVYFFFALRTDNDLIFLWGINNISRFAIPFFFISSGILLTPFFDRTGMRVFWYKKLRKLILPYVLMNILVALFYSLGIVGFLYILFTGNGMVPYYFVVVLLQLYVLFPLLLLFGKSRRAFVLIFLISLIFFFLPWTWQIFSTTFFGKFIFFFFYGLYMKEYFLSDYVPAHVRKESLPWVVIIALYVFSFLVLPGLHYNSRFFYGVALFNLLFLFRRSLLSLPISPIINYFGKNSLWIFLTHFPVVFVSYLLAKEFINNYYMLFSVVTAISVVLSLAVGILASRMYSFAETSILSFLSRSK